MHKIKALKLFHLLYTLPASLKNIFFYQWLSVFLGQYNKKLYFVAVHLHVLVRTDSGVHTFKQRTEKTIFTEAGHVGRVPHRTTIIGLGATSPAAS